jgi:predicted esterase
MKQVDSSRRRPVPWLVAVILALCRLGGAGVDGMEAVATAAVPAVLGAPVALPAAPASSGASPGWQQVELGAQGSYFWLYLPKGWDGTTALPLVVFLHGSGSNPELYLNFLFPAAEAAGALTAVPKSSSDLGWGVGNDEQIVAATVAAAEAMAPVDLSRVSIAGHSAGGAYAYLLAYGTVSHYSAVFSMSAPFYPVSEVADPAYKAPIHMYYGTVDPNYSGGAYARLTQQWDALSVPWESDIEPAYGHNNWPPDSMSRGFQFLVSKSYGTCAADATHPCLQHRRFRVAVTWQDGSGHTGVGSVVPAAASANSAVLWFFDPGNWEMLVKVLDGCALNQRIWVFSAATTNVEYTLTVTDTVTHQVRTYHNPAGQSAAAITDTDAFSSCPVP